MDITSLPRSMAEFFVKHYNGSIARHEKDAAFFLEQAEVYDHGGFPHLAQEMRSNASNATAAAKHNRKIVDGLVKRFPDLEQSEPFCLVPC